MTKREDIAELLQQINDGIEKLSTYITTYNEIEENIKNPVAVAAEYLGIDVKKWEFTDGYKHSPASIDEQINEMYTKGVERIISILVKKEVIAGEKERKINTFGELLLIFSGITVHHYQTINPNNTTTKLVKPQQIYYDLFIAFSHGMNYAIEHKGPPASEEEFKKEFARIRGIDSKNTLDAKDYLIV